MSSEGHVDRPRHTEQSPATGTALTIKQNVKSLPYLTSQNEPGHTICVHKVLLRIAF